MIIGVVCREPYSGMKMLGNCEERSSILPIWFVWIWWLPITETDEGVRLCLFTFVPTIDTFFSVTLSKTLSLASMFSACVVVIPEIVNTAVRATVFFVFIICFLTIILSSAKLILFFYLWNPHLYGFFTKKAHRSCDEPEILEIVAWKLQCRCKLSLIAQKEKNLVRFLPLARIAACNMKNYL